MVKPDDHSAHLSGLGDLAHSMAKAKAKAKAKKFKPPRLAKKADDRIKKERAAELEASKAMTKKLASGKKKKKGFIRSFFESLLPGDSASKLEKVAEIAAAAKRNRE